MPEASTQENKQTMPESIRTHPKRHLVEVVKVRVYPKCEYAIFALRNKIIADNKGKEKRTEKSAMRCNAIRCQR